MQLFIFGLLFCSCVALVDTVEQSNVLGLLGGVGGLMGACKLFGGAVLIHESPEAVEKFISRVPKLGSVLLTLRDITISATIAFYVFFFLAVQTL